MTFLLRVAVVVLLLFLSARSDAAENASDLPRKPAPVGIKIRPAAPLTRWSLVNGNLFQASFGGASTTVEILELVAIELGGNYFVTGPIGTGAEFFTRAGVSPRIVDARHVGRGWVMQLDAFVGYRFFARNGSGDPKFNDTTHLFSPSAGVQATYWITPHVGFNMRLSGGVSLAMAHDTTGLRGYASLAKEWDYPYSIEWGLDLGIAVH